jgi:hypothetical protein
MKTILRKHYPYLLFGLTLCFTRTDAQFSASSGQAGTVTTSATTQGTDWSNPLNVQSSDNVFATCLITGSNKPTYYLDAKNWGFQSSNNALPNYIQSAAVINGIEVFIKLKKTNVGNIRDNKIILLKAGAEAGSSKARGSTTWPGTATEIKFGSNIDLWGTTWTAADLINTGFGIRISGKNRGSKDAQAEIDYIHINIYFNQVYYYSKSAGNLELTTSWGMNPDGSGSNPLNFTNNGQIFFLKNRTTATLTNNFSISGIYSKLVVGDAAAATTLTVPSNYTLSATVDIASLSNLTITNTVLPTIGAVSDNTTVTYNASGDQTVAEAGYYNLSVSGSGIKTINSSTGSIVINNILSIASGTTLDNQGNNVQVYGVSAAISNNGIATGTGRYVYALLDINTNITGTGSYSNLEIDFSTTTTAKTLTISNATTITGTLYLTDGIVANGTNLTMSAGSTIELADGTLANSISASSGYDVVYDPYTTSSPKTTANELTGSLRNFTLQTGSGLAVNLNRNLVATGNLVLTNGTLDPSSSNYNITIGGNYTNNASLTYRNNIITLNGAAAQSVDASSPQIFYDAVINNTTGGIQLNTAVTVNHSLTLTNGIVNSSNTNLLSLADGSAISGGNSSSYINGPLRHLLAATSGIKFFPVGKSGAYRPATLSVTQITAASTSYTAELFTGAPPSRTLPATLSQVSSVRYYTITSGNNANLSSATVQINYGLDDNVTDPATLRIAKSSGSNWLDIGGTGSAAGTGNITSVAFTSFSDFVLATKNNIVLPLKWISFTGTIQNGIVQLKWQTAEEINTAYFNVEKSSNGFDWQVIGVVNSTSNSVNNYSFNDNRPSSQNFYRINSVDRDGKASYSKLVHLVTNTSERITIAGNPAKKGTIELLISDGLLQQEKVEIKIFTESGRLILSEQKRPEPALLISSDKLVGGSYIVIAKAGNIVHRSRYIVQ